MATVCPSHIKHPTHLPVRHPGFASGAQRPHDATSSRAYAAQCNFNTRSTSERVEVDPPSPDTSRDPDCELCADLDGCHECHLCCPVYGTSRILCYCQCHN